MNRPLTRSFLAAFTLLAIIHIGRGQLNELHRLRGVQLAGVLAIAAIHLLICWLQGATIQVSMRAFAVTSSVRDGFAATILGSYANLLLPRSAAGLAALYFKQRQQVPLIDFATVTAGNGILFIVAAAIGGLGAVTLGAICNGQRINGVLIGLYSAALSISLLALSCGRHVDFVGRWIKSDRWTRAFNGWLRLRSADVLCELLCLHLGLTALRAVRLHLAFLSLGLTVPWTGTLLASTLSDLLFVVSVTPGAIGFREAGIAMVAGQLACAPATALSAAIVDRLVFSLTVLLTAQIILLRGVGTATPRNATGATHAAAVSEITNRDRSATA